MPARSFNCLVRVIILKARTERPWSASLWEGVQNRNSIKTSITTSKKKGRLIRLAFLMLLSSHVLLTQWLDHFIVILSICRHFEIFFSSCLFLKDLAPRDAQLFCLHCAGFAKLILTHHRLDFADAGVFTTINWLTTPWLHTGDTHLTNHVASKPSWL